MRKANHYVTNPRFSYCLQMIRNYDRDRFLQCLFIPEPQREAMAALWALNIELQNVHGAVSEEMLGHIRYAWWFEGVEELYAGKQVRGQPVLLALVPVAASVPKEILLPVVETYQSSYPELPVDAIDKTEIAAHALIEALCPKAKAGWDKAGDVIARHRTRFGASANGWLALKLFFQ